MYLSLTWTACLIWNLVTHDVACGNGKQKKKWRIRSPYSPNGQHPYHVPTHICLSYCKEAMKAHNTTHTSPQDPDQQTRLT